MCIRDRESLQLNCAIVRLKVLLYLKKSEPDKTGKAPIMGRITLNRTMEMCIRDSYNSRLSIQNSTVS